MAGESTSVVVLMSGAIAAMFSALLAIVWTVIRKYERLLDLNSADLKTVLEGSNRALVAVQQGVVTANELIKEQGRTLLVELREQRTGITTTGGEILRNQQEFKREIDLIKTRLDYTVRRQWPDPPRPDAGGDG